jgi:predicted  nucleic acid-binding Zn-ribbon protein
LIRNHQIEINQLRDRQKYEMEMKSKQVEDLERGMRDLRVEVEGERAQVQQFKITINTMNASAFAMESELGMFKAKLLGICE